jgi:hypothetical protein
LDAKNRIKQLEAERDGLRRQLDILLKPAETQFCRLHIISFQEARDKGFNYPRNTLHVGIDYRDNSVMLILPEKEPETVNKPDTQHKGDK